jgi:hypothetical protein
VVEVEEDDPGRRQGNGYFARYVISPRFRS